jgi:diphthine-ammonia ligase
METALACQHVARVTDALKNNSGGGWVGYPQAALYWLADINHLPHVEHGHRRSSMVANFMVFLFQSNKFYVQILKEAHSPTLFVIIKALPKEALIEKQVFLHTGRCSIIDEDEISIQPREPIFEQGLVFVLSILRLLTSNDRSFRFCCRCSITMADVTLSR